MNMKIENVFASNLQKLMAASKRLDSNLKLAKACGLGNGTISRFRNSESSASINNVQAIAEAYGLNAADLLRSDLFDDMGNLQKYAAQDSASTSLPTHMGRVVAAMQEADVSPELCAALVKIIEAWKK